MHVMSFSSHRSESQVFKSKFAGWDDIIAVDYTRSTESVLKKPTIQRVS